MMSSAMNQIAGMIHEVKGKMKEKAGRLTNNPRLEAEGVDENIIGTVQREFGHVERVAEK
jgi:uncharacterized protein YjbJ (UPF0337 family)